MPTKLSKVLAISLITLSLVSGATLAYAWTVPPGANVDEPINRGTKAQSKGGGFGALWGIFTDLLITNSIQGTNATTGATSTLALNPGGGNVGIGTATPAAKLDVAGTIMSATPAADAIFVGTGDLWQHEIS